MIRHYLIYFIRNISRQKMYTGIIIFSLVTGMACCILIGAWMLDELSYDRFHHNADRIYRIAQTEHRDTGDFSLPLIHSAMAPLLIRDYPGVEAFVRFSRRYQSAVSFGEHNNMESGFFYADQSMFRVFDFILTDGDPQEALLNPGSVVITESMAEKYFRESNPIGKTIFVDQKEEYQITGVMRNVPSNSHIHFDFLASFSSLKDEYGPMIDTYWAYPCYTYLFIPDPEDAVRLQETFSDFILRHKGEAWQSYRDFFLQKLSRIHLHSRLNFELEPNGDIRDVHLFCLISLLMMIVACMNYMNLYTAQSSKRIKEVGIRKVLGADRTGLVKQFLLETIFCSLLALPPALCLVALFLPGFNAMTDKSLDWHTILNRTMLIPLLSLFLFAGFTSGFYPALFLSSFSPARMVGRCPDRFGSGASVRRILVIAQFSVTVVLTAGTCIIVRQVNFMKNAELGFQKENMLIIRMDDEESQSHYQSLKNGMLQYPEIQSVSASSGIPGAVSLLGVFRPEGVPGDQQYAIRNILVDTDFIRTMEIEMIAGRNFSKNIASDRSMAYLINETASEYFGWEDLRDQTLEDMEFGIRGTVVGKVKNFHFQSKHRIIEPLVIRMLPDPSFIHFLIIRLNTDDLDHALASVEQVWSAFQPHRPMDFFVLEEFLDGMYRQETRLTHIFRGLTGLVVVIACLGLFGLAAFTAERRMKEIGIRKVLGAKMFEILLRLYRDFMPLILISNFIAWPVAYLFFQRWLQNYMYRVHIGTGMMLFSIILSVMIFGATISVMVVKAASANPVESLRYE